MNTALTRILLVVAPLLLAVLGFVGGWLWNLGLPPDDRAPAHLADLEGIVCAGVVDVEAGVASLGLLQPGRVAAVLAHENDGVAAGAVLVRLEDGLARNRVAEAEAAVAAAKVRRNEASRAPEQHRLQLARQEAARDAAGQRLAAARTLLERTRKLRDNKQIGPEEADAAERQVRELEALVRAEELLLAELNLIDPEASLRRAEADLAAAEARLGQARQSLAECSLTAPSSGKVLRVLVSPGDLVTGQPGRPMVLFCPAEPRLIRCEVEQEFAGVLAVGRDVTAEDDAGGGVWHGRVLRVADWFAQRRTLATDPGQLQDVRTVECLVELDPGQPPLRIGQRMRVTVGRSTRPPAEIDR